MAADPMQSPRVEWVLGIGYLAAVDWIRDRGEPDGDTLTEVLRDAFHVDHPAGRAGLAAVIAASSVVFYRHLTKPAMRAYVPCLAALDTERERA